jgi:hypothetical protein
MWMTRIWIAWMVAMVAVVCCFFAVFAHLHAAREREVSADPSKAPLRVLTVEGSPVNVFHDDERGVTCYASAAGGISCLKDPDERVDPDSGVTTFDAGRGAIRIDYHTVDGREHWLEVTLSDRGDRKLDLLLKQWLGQGTPL